MSNFDFLKSEYPELASLGALAEELIDTDAASCLTKLRIIGEFIAKDIYYKYFYTKSKLTQCELLKVLEPYIDQKYLDIFHIIRKYGNYATHENIATKEKAHQILQFAWGLCVWHYVTNCNGNSENIQPYVKPVSRLILLEKELDEANKKNEEIEKNLQSKINELETQISFKNDEAKKYFIQKQTEKAEEANRLSDLTEAETRHFIIDNMLLESGWNLKKVEDFDSPVKNFDTDEVRREILVEGLPNTSSGKGYIDYALYDANNNIIAIIEAKRSRRDVKEGREQAFQYANALERMTGFRPLIFYTNGFETYFWDDVNYPPRRVYGMFSKDDIETRLFQRADRKPLEKVKIDTSITERNYQIEAIRRTYESFSAGHRKALIVMATGTGKTRTAMSIIKGLVEANWVKRVLFLVDRDELRKQADSAFNKYLSSLSRVLLNASTRGNQNQKVYIATYPSMLKAYQMYTPGFFDLIIADESHRSIYNVYSEIFKYFDSFQIGLTATPVDYISRNTFKMFNTENGNPTYSYELDEAIKEHFLVPYKVKDVQTDFLQRGIKYEDLTPEQKAELREQVEDPESFNFESKEIEIQITNKETNRKIIRALMDNGLRDNNGKLGKSIIFARSHKHGEMIEDLFNQMYPEYHGKYARLIDSHDPNASILLDNFKGENGTNEINIAISVSMLDTGVDVPEILNLVFAKPIYSKVKFWQMIGRGTRLCKDLLGIGKDKKEFLIFDNYGNFKFFGENPEGYIPKEQLTLYERLFLTRVSLAISAKESGNDEVYSEAVKMLKNDIASLPKKSVDVQEHARQLDDILNNDYYWQNLDDDFINILDTVIRPLMKRHTTSFAQDKAMQFEIIVTQLQVAELEKQILDQRQVDTKYQEKKIESLKNYIQRRVFQLRENINKVKEKQATINKVKSEDFKSPFKFRELEEIKQELSPIMQYSERDSISEDIIKIDITDEIVVNEDFNLSLYPIFGEGYRYNLERFLNKISNENIVLQKIKKGHKITEQDLEALVSIVLEQNPHFSLTQLEKLYPDKANDIDLLIRSIIGVDEEEIEKRINNFIKHHTTITPIQMKCLTLVKNQLKANRYIKVGCLYEQPFSRLGYDIFTEEEIEELMQALDGYVIKQMVG